MGGNYYSEGDLSINCASDFYVNPILTINLSLIILLGFGIPIALGIKLRSLAKKKMLSTFHT